MAGKRLASIRPVITLRGLLIPIGIATRRLLELDQVVNLYAKYSNINIRPDREAILAELGRIARDKFQGVVTRNMTTSLSIARRI